MGYGTAWAGCAGTRKDYLISSQDEFNSEIYSTLHKGLALAQVKRWNYQARVAIIGDDGRPIFLDEKGKE